MAKLMNCPDCGASVSKRALACPSCGRQLKRPAKRYGCGTGCLLVVVGLVVLAIIAPKGKRQPVDAPVEPPIVERPIAGPSSPQPIPSGRVPHPGPMEGDAERIFGSAREHRQYRGPRAKLEEGDAKDIAQIKAVYAAEKLGLPVRIVQTHDWNGGFRYIVITGKQAAHVVNLTPESEVVSVRELYDARGTPRGLEVLYRK